jgi:hypothetical protein
MPINFSKITFDQLGKTHPDRDFWWPICMNYRLLYRGGEEFLRAAGQTTSTRAAGAQAQTSPVLDLMTGRNRRRRFLYQLEGEPDTKYISRWERAYYIGYIGAIIDYFRHWQFSQTPDIRPADSAEQPDWFEPFLADSNGSGYHLMDFVKDVFGDVLQVRKCGWLIGRPSDSIGGKLNETASDVPTDSPVTLTPYPFEDMLDWQEDDAGELQWILLKKEKLQREFPDDRKRVEIRTYVDRNSWACWEVHPKEGAGGSERAEFIDSGDHGLGKVPFVMLEVPHGLWPANKLATWQVSLFNQMSMLDYAQLMACFPQPVLTTPTPGEASHIFGESMMLELRAGNDGRASETFTWVVAPTEPLEFSSKRILEQRDEGYRIVHQMSLAVDSQAIGAIARSGASKIEDRRAAEVILCAYGGYIRDAIIRTLNTISEIMGDKVKWVCDGFDNFQVSSLEEELQTAALVSTFGFWSKTAEAELHKQIETGRVLAHIDEATKNTIREEIDDKREQDEENALAPQFMPDGSVAPPVPPTVQPAKNGMPPMQPKTQVPMPPGPRPAVTTPLGRKASANG